MSDSPFMLPHPPRVTAEQARDTARAYKALADHLEPLGDRAGARRAMTESQWWMAYSIALATGHNPKE
jgi:hypothetical protein